MKTLLLLGGGHAHLAVLKQFENGIPLGWRVQLVSPYQQQTYTGMLPGWIAGHYSLRECQIDLKKLCEGVGVELIIDTAIDIDAEFQTVKRGNGEQLEYDLLSIDIGGETDIGSFTLSSAQLVPIRPLNGFIQKWTEIIRALEQGKSLRIAVVGGGAAGVELALAMQYIKKKLNLPLEIDFVCSARGILPGFAASVIGLAQQAIIRSGLVQHLAKAEQLATGLALANGDVIYPDFIIAATGVRAPTFLRSSKLTLNQHGFIAVNEAQQSTSHHNVFAAGDIGSTLIEHAKSGVHAVRAGPVLAQNLFDVMKGSLPKRLYKTRKVTLYLLATGPQHAVASWGHLSAQGHWVWRWKCWIDKKFISKYQ